MTPLDLAQQDWLERNPDASPDLVQAHLDWLKAKQALREARVKEQAALRNYWRERDKNPLPNHPSGSVNEGFHYQPGLPVVWPNAQGEEF